MVVRNIVKYWKYYLVQNTDLDLGKCEFSYNMSQCEFNKSLLLARIRVLNIEYLFNILKLSLISKLFVE